STLATGSHALTAVYSGDGSFATSTSPTVTQVVNPAAAAATSTSLSSTPNPSTVGQTVTLSSTVTSGAGVPTRTVTFRDGATTIRTGRPSALAPARRRRHTTRPTDRAPEPYHTPPALHDT